MNVEVWQSYVTLIEHTVCGDHLLVLSAQLQTRNTWVWMQLQVKYMLLNASDLIVSEEVWFVVCISSRSWSSLLICLPLVGVLTTLCLFSVKEFGYGSIIYLYQDFLKKGMCYASIGKGTWWPQAVIWEVRMRWLLSKNVNEYRKVQSMFFFLTH